MNHNNKNKFISNAKKQTGAVLLWSLVILLVLLIMGVTSIRLSGMDTRIAGNEMHRMLTYQGVESTIVRTATLFYLDKASGSANHKTEKTGMTDSVALSRTPVNVSSRANIEMVDDSMDCPVLTGLANSVDASSRAGSMNCQLYAVEAHSNLAGSGARSQHSVGIVKFVPAISGR